MFSFNSIEQMLKQMRGTNYYPRKQKKPIEIVKGYPDPFLVNKR